ncbi:hypothetical protein [uncultured Capnocytophaga sp.]|nr:hypothetical protein [uncultured Capnocytophaga sp.]
MRKLLQKWIKKQVIHHINRDWSHQVIETKEILFGIVIKRELRTELM